METKVIKISLDESRDKEILKQRLRPAADLISAGECVAFPTETVYGLGALALNPEAINKVFEAKGRPNDNPLIAHVNKLEELSDLVCPLSPLVKDFIQLFSPGPITYVLKKQAHVPDELTAGLDTVAVRIPAKAIARALIALCGAPIAAPSANLSGSPSPTEASHVVHDLEGRIPLIIDGGSCEVGLESTVLDLSDEEDIKILRPGAVTAERLIRFLETREDFRPFHKDWRERLQAEYFIHEEAEIPKAPGMKYKHYAPETPVYVLRGTSLKSKERAFSEILRKLRPDVKLGLYISDGLAERILSHVEDTDREVHTLVFEYSEDSSIASQHLFAALRELDEENLDLILVEALTHSEFGTAYMNRLEKASGGVGHVLPEVLLRAVEEDKAKVLFVCTGNTCRSPMAEYLFNHLAKIRALDWCALSAGLAAFPGDAINYKSERVLLDDYGLDASAHRARRLLETEVQASDLVLTMSEAQAEALREALPKYALKVHSFAAYLNEADPDFLFDEVGDPFGASLEVYEKTAAQLEAMTASLIELLLEADLK